MAKIDLVITGDAELNAKLKRLKGSAAKAAIRKASRAALRPVQAAAKSMAPKDSGRLKRSIRIRAMKRSRSRVGSRLTTSGYDNAFKGRTYYAAFQEFGWRSGRRVRNVDMGLERGKRRTEAQKAQAKEINGKRRLNLGQFFLKRAATMMRNKAIGIYKSELRRMLEEV